MKRFKVYGEERSGTTYLEKLMKTNTDLTLLSNRAKPLDKWKHGFPHYWGEDTLHLFLVRDLYEWLRSVININGGRFNGLAAPFGNTPDTQHGHWQAWENILECRYAKLTSYVEFIIKYPGVLIKTEYLKDNPEVIGEFARVNGFKDIKMHTRLGKPVKDDPGRPELSDEDLQWINDNLDPRAERFVDRLTYINAL